VVENNEGAVGRESARRQAACRQERSEQQKACFRAKGSVAGLRRCVFRFGVVFFPLVEIVRLGRTLQQKEKAKQKREQGGKKKKKKKVSKSATATTYGATVICAAVCPPVLLTKLTIFGHPSLSFSRMVHSLQ
jgi:preprotein translocase subunit SecG